MEAHAHEMSQLFAQLGLASDVAAIERFVTNHGPLPAAMLLSDAPFWNSGQADFLREGTLGDADWSDVIDRLNAALRARAR
jgi:Protein of unknown function (DUF2789)